MSSSLTASSRIQVLHPPGLLDGWICVLDSSVPMPYFYNASTLRTTWKIPHDPSYLERTNNQASGEESPSEEETLRLVTLLTNRKRILDDEKDTTTAETKTTSSTTINSRTLKASHPDQPDRPIRIEDRNQQSSVATSFQDNSKHPLHIARTKLNTDVITDAEYLKIVQTHKEMEREQRSIVLEGELKKKGQRLGRFVKRWFVLHSDHMLSSCRSSNHVDSPTTIIDLSKCTCMPLDGVSGQPHCIEMTEMHGDTETILAAPTAEIQVAWLEAMLSTKTKTMGLGRLNVIKCAAALKNVKRRAKMPSM